MLFLHANAYPPGCYNKFLRALGEKYRITAPDQRPLWEGSEAGKLSHWSIFGDDLLEMLKSRQGKRIRVVGHSLGAIAALLAAIKKPDLFHNMVLIDPVILESTWSRGSFFLPFFLKKKYLPIVKTAWNRRNEWQSTEEIRSHFQKKKLFQRFDPEVFEDFVQYGFIFSAGRYQLKFPPEWEARIYATPPNLWKLLPKIQVPTSILRAEYSDVIGDESWKQIKRLIPSGNFYEISGAGHLIPLEKPLELAELIKTDFH